MDKFPAGQLTHNPTAAKRQLIKMWISFQLTHNLTSFLVLTVGIDKATTVFFFSYPGEVLAQEEIFSLSKSGSSCLPT